MAASVTMFYDVVCPYAYLASTQIRRIADAAGAELTWKPMLLGGVFRATGSPDVPATQLPAARVRWNARDVEMSARRLGVTLRVPQGHPRRSVEAMRLLTAARLDAPARLETLTRTLYEAYWVDGRNITERSVLGEIAAAHGIDIGVIDSERVKLALREMTDEAVREGVFGAPSFIVEGPGGRRLIFGQDRLHFVDRALRGVLGRPAEVGGDGRAAGSPAHAGARDAAGAHAGGRDAAGAHAGARGAAGAARALTFLFDYSSPFTYLASTQIERVAAATGAALTWKPIFLGGLFKDLGGPLVPIAVMGEAKRRYQLLDLQDWAAWWNVPFRWPSRFPIMTVTALRMALAAGAGLTRFSHAVFRAFWVEDRDINDKATLVEIAGTVGLDGAALLEQAATPEIKARLADNTAEALRDGAFGLPAFLVGGLELHFGQDRLDFVRDVITTPAS